MIKSLAMSIVTTYLQMAPYLLLGLTFAGILHVFFKKDFIARHLGKDTCLSSVKAAVLGVPLPICSCGVIPTALSLRKSRASRGATVSFLISTPQTGVDSIIATYGMLGPVFAIFRPVAAFVMGVVGGCITTLLCPAEHSPAASPQDSDCPACLPADKPVAGGIRKVGSMVRYAYGEFLDDIVVQLLIGIGISGVISVFLPPDFFTRYVGNDLVEMLLMIVGGIPLYVCATASIPIAMAMMAKGLSAGAAFVFLAVGPATNAASIVLITKVMGKRVAAIYLGVIALFSMVAGLLLNQVVPSFSAGEEHAHHHHHHAVEGGVDTAAIVWSSIFLIMILLSLVRKFFPGIWSTVIRPFAHARQETVPVTATTVVRVEGMTCNHCAGHVAEAVRAVPGVLGVQVDLNAKKAVVTGTFELSGVLEAIRQAGYTAFDSKEHG